jgi:uncharacterized protein DUF3232
MNIPKIDLSELDESIRNAKPAITYAALKAICEGDEILGLCLEDFLDHALRYTETVCKFQQIVIKYGGSNEDGMLVEIDRIRKTIHDSLISSTQILSRTMGKRGKDNSWFDQLPNRAAIGRFALIESFEFLKSIRKEDAS